MLEIAQLTAEKLGNLDVLSRSGVATAVNQMSSLKASRLIVTDQSGYIVFDTIENSTGKFVAFPQIVEALKGNNVFTWNYSSGAMRSEVATPIVSHTILIGCVYMMEYDTEQGSIIYSLQMTILTITIILELVVLVYSIAFSRGYSHRLTKIMNSMRIIQDGNYSHTVDVEGNDELSFLAKEFNDLTSRLQVSENKRRQFVSDASHELKTPLATIKLLSDSILHNDMDLDTVREFVGDIGDEAERLNRMTEKLLDLTRGENPTEEDPKEIIMMAPIVEKVAHMLSTLAKSSEVTVITNVSKDVPILIREDDLYRIIFNLAENGLKYNVPNGTLTISLGHNEDFGIIEVSDTGTGIPKECLGKIFERFYRVDKARSRKTGGSGLGLSIVRNMVERNQGKIDVDSEPGKGTTFTVQFPKMEAEADHS